MAEAQEFPQEPIESRDFAIEGPEEDIKVHQKGRVSRLTDPSTGQNAYFIDVTDSVDPSRDDFGDPKGDLISDIYINELEDPNYNDRFGMWQSVSAVITDKLDPQERKRIYVGFPVTDLTDIEKPKELTQPILLKAGFKHDRFYMPFTAHLDSSNMNSIEQTREIIAREIISATKETPAKGRDVLQQASRVLTAV